jgi:hypothetical protein
MFTDIIIQIGTKASLSKAVSIHVFSVFVLALLAALSVPPLYADIYSWTDRNGVKHFSNVPPPPNIYSFVDVKREHVYDEAADEERWKLEEEEWHALEKDLKNTEKQEIAANETEAEKRDDVESLDEKIEREKFMLQNEIKRLDRMPASSFSQQLDGKRAAIAFYRARLKMLEDDPERYFKIP